MALSPINQNSNTNYTHLIDEYTPALILYPEIQDETRRLNPNYPEETPLFNDYHPRDIKIVLDNAGLYKQGKCRDWKEMLDKMEENDYEEHIKVVPELNLDDRDGFWKRYHEIKKDKYQETCYARVVTGQGIYTDQVLVQYWYAYFYNDFWNAHEMDWEVIMIVFNGKDKPEPIACAGSGHFQGEWIRRADVEKVDSKLKESKEGPHPIVYVANGSHASYFRGDRIYRTSKNSLARAALALNREQRGLLDYTTSMGKGKLCLAKATEIPQPNVNGEWEGDFRWLNQQGRWGSPGDWDFEFGDSGIYGPTKSGDKWYHPFRWIFTDCNKSNLEGDFPFLLSE